MLPLDLHLDLHMDLHLHLDLHLALHRHLPGKVSPNVDYVPLTILFGFALK